MRIVCISDTHTLQKRMIHNIPSGDVLVHAGDFMDSGWEEREYLPFLRWFNSFPHKHKIFIAGNHDRYTEMNEESFRKDVKAFGSAIYLRDEEYVIDGVKFYGSPWQKWFHSWAWNMPKEPHKYEIFATNHWDKIPTDTNVLITHGQPYKINDQAPDGEYTGCQYLLNKIHTLSNLELFVGGHIHCEYGTKLINGVTYINPAICTEEYAPINAPIVFDL